MAISVSVDGSSRISLGNKVGVIASLSLDSSYATGGYALTPDKLSLSQIQQVVALDQSGYSCQWDYTNNKFKVYVTGAASPTFTGTVPFAANAVTAVHVASPLGVNLFVDYSEDGDYFLNANFNGQGDADVFATLNSGGKVVIKHDLTPDGVQLYLDEDASPSTGRLLVALPTLVNGYIRSMDGYLLPLTYNSAPNVSGVALSYNSNGTRFEFNSPTTANGTFNTSTSGWVVGAPAGSVSFTAAAEAEVDNGTNLSAVTGWKVLFIGL